MKDSWEEQLRQKLEGHCKTPPAGLWEGISREMGLKAEPVRKPITIRRWWWAAAAIVLVLVGFFVFHERLSNQYLSRYCLSNQYLRCLMSNLKRLLWRRSPRQKQLFWLPLIW